MVPRTSILKFDRVSLKRFMVVSGRTAPQNAQPAQKLRMAVGLVELVIRHVCLDATISGPMDPGAFMPTNRRRRPRLHSTPPEKTRMALLRIAV